MKSLGFILMQIALIMFISSGAADVLLTFVFNGTSSHLSYWKNATDALGSQVTTLDQVMARTVGVLFLLLGLSGQIILHEMVRLGNKRGLVYLIGILGAGVLIYASPLAVVKTSQFAIPVLSLLLLLTGAGLWLFRFPFRHLAK
jgi:hypothetical protein